MSIFHYKVLKNVLCDKNKYFSIKVLENRFHFIQPPTLNRCYNETIQLAVTLKYILWSWRRLFNCKYTKKQQNYNNWLTDWFPSYLPFTDYFKEIHVTYSLLITWGGSNQFQHFQKLHYFEGLRLHTCFTKCNVNESYKISMTVWQDARIVVT